MLTHHHCLYYELETEDIRTGIGYVRFTLVTVWEDNGRYYMDETSRQYHIDAEAAHCTPARRAALREELFTLWEKDRAAASA